MESLDLERVFNSQYLFFLWLVRIILQSLEELVIPFFFFFLIFHYEDLVVSWGTGFRKGIEVCS